MRPPPICLAFKIVASLFAAVVALYLARDIALPRAVVLSFSACADTAQTLRAFYSDGSAPGFCRTRFTEQTIGRTGQFVRLHFDLPVTKLAGLRLQVGDRPGRIVLKDVQLRPRGDLDAAVLRRCRLRQIVVADAAHGQIELLLSDSKPLLIFKSRDVAATARRTPNPALVFSIMVLAYLGIFRIFDWLTWQKPVPPAGAVSALPGCVRPRSFLPDVLFLAAVACISVWPASKIDTESTVSRENRRLKAYRPLIVHERLNNEYGTDFEAWFADRFRDRLATIQRHRRVLDLVDRAKNNRAFEGDDGWLFYRSVHDGDSVSDYIGRSRHPETFKQETARLLERLQDALDARGTRLVLMVVPNKEQIYPRYLRSLVKQANPVSRTDDLLAYLVEHTDVPIIYPKQEMLALANRYELYFRSDTHWNPLGAFIAFQQLRDTLFGVRLRLEDQSIVAATNVTGDLATILSIPTVRESFALAGPAVPEAPDGTLCENPAAPQSLTLLFVGDSFRMALKPFLFSEFRKSFFLHRREFKPEILQEVRPDVVVLQFAERYTACMASELDWESLFEPTISP